MNSSVDKIDFIDLSEQYALLKSSIDARIQTVLDHRNFILGPEVTELEERLAEYIGVRHCIGVSDGTTALLIAMMAVGIEPGDEVITTPFTFIATGEMISLLGARPVFVDIDPESYNIDPTRIEAAITDRTKAIMPVSLFGQCADMDRINEVAYRNGLAVIEDGAQSFGATYHGRKSCGLSTIGCTSFFPSKPLGCYGDGGACFTDDDRLAERMRQIRAHGQAERYRHVCIGLNGRLDTIQAAILLAKFENFPREVQQRAEVGARYARLLHEAAIEGIVAPAVLPANTHVFAQYTLRVPESDRPEVIKHLAAAGVPSAVHYPLPLHRQPVFEQEHGGEHLPHAERAAREVLSVPMYPTMRETLQRRIVTALANAMADR